MYYDTILFPLMLKAMKNNLTLLFMDGYHFVMGCDFLGYIYGKTLRFIKTFSGRKRYYDREHSTRTSAHCLETTGDHNRQVRTTCSMSPAIMAFDFVPTNMYGLVPSGATMSLVPSPFAPRRLRIDNNIVEERNYVVLCRG
jgi:hypothetical protein